MYIGISRRKELKETAEKYISEEWIVLDSYNPGTALNYKRPRE